jgi:alkylhydroperoxidase family enzyme
MRISPTREDESKEEIDVDLRNAEILEKPQRIESLMLDELDADAKEYVAKMRQSLNSSTTKISDVFGLMLRHPGLFHCQMEMGIQLTGKGALNPRERELTILRVAWWCGAPYEWGEHVNVAKRYGISSDEVERITKGSAAPDWTKHERAIICGVEELLGKQMISDDTWDILAQTWDERQLMEFPVLVGQYFSIALQQNSLRVRLGDNNIGLRQR